MIQFILLIPTLNMDRKETKDIPITEEKSLQYTHHEILQMEFPTTLVLTRTEALGKNVWGLTVQLLGFGLYTGLTI